MTKLKSTLRALKTLMLMSVDFIWYISHLVPLYQIIIIPHCLTSSILSSLCHNIILIVIVINCFNTILVTFFWNIFRIKNMFWFFSSNVNPLLERWKSIIKKINTVRSMWRFLYICMIMSILMSANISWYICHLVPLYHEAKSPDGVISPDTFFRPLVITKSYFFIVINCFSINIFI